MVDAATQMRKRRANAKSKGLCDNCMKRPAIINRGRCERCQMVAIIKEAFKFDKKRKLKGSTQARGTCYVPQYKTAIRAAWNKEIIEKFTGFCYYTRIQIEVGSTAGLNFKLPVSRVEEFGPNAIFCPNNLVWCHKGIALLKGSMTDVKFANWLRSEFIQFID